MPVLTAEQNREKNARARLRECFDQSITHLRAGTWQGLDGAEVTRVGTVAELHGPTGLCTCCPRRDTAS